jgi:hypothetical protein
MLLSCHLSIFDESISYPTKTIFLKLIKPESVTVITPALFLTARLALNKTHKIPYRKYMPSLLLQSLFPLVFIMLLGWLSGKLGYTRREDANVWQR